MQVYKRKRKSAKKIMQKYEEEKKQKKGKICNILYLCQYQRNLNNAGYIC